MKQVHSKVTIRVTSGPSADGDLRGTMMTTPLPQQFYERDPATVARELIGMRLVRRSLQGICSGIIVETEAYLAADDPASHSHRGRTKKNKSMFRRGGLLYVYPIHGRHCLNAVTEFTGIASAVLIRAVVPQQGVDRMLDRRQCPPADLTRGPARLCEAFAVDRRLDGWDLTLGSRIWIEQADQQFSPDWSLSVSPRIGVTSGHQLALRYFLSNCQYVSGPRRIAGASAVDPKPQLSAMSSVR